MCVLSGDDRERRQVVSTFIKQGLAGKDRVIYFFSDLARANSVLDFLQPGARRELLSIGQLGLASTADSVLGNGRFDPERAVEQLRREANATVEAGWRGLRVLGDAWALRTPGIPQLLDSERGVTDAVSGLPVSVLCEYDPVGVGAERADQFLRAHPGRVGVDPWRSHGSMRVFRLFQPPGIRVEGDVDAHSGAEFSAALGELVKHADDHGDTHLDLSGLTFIDVNGLRELARAATQLPEGRRLVLHHLSPHHRELITVLRWHEFPELCLDREAS